MSGSLRDLRYAPRQLCKGAELAATAVFTLALGVDAITVMVSVTGATLLNSPSFPVSTDKLHSSQAKEVSEFVRQLLRKLNQGPTIMQANRTV